MMSVSNMFKALRTKDVRPRILFWATLIALAVGSDEFGEPVDVLFRVGRNAIRAHDADGSIVIAGMDDNSADELGGFPWSRVHDAAFIEKAMSLGAKRIFYDKMFVDRGDPAANAKLVKVLKDNPGKIYFGSALTFGATKSQDSYVLPAKVFRNHVLISNLNVELGFGGYAVRTGRLSRYRGQSYPALSSLIADRPELSNRAYRPDYSIRASSFPTYTYANILQGSIPKGALKGKDVVVGAISKSMHDDHWVPGQSSVPGVYTHAIAAQTLKSANPIDLGWLPGLFVGFTASIAHIYAPSRKPRALAALVGFAALMFMPLILDILSITTDIAPGIMLMLICVLRFTLYNRARRNLTSDLPNLAAFREIIRGDDETIIVLRVHNYAEIAASFADSTERELVQQVTHRLRAYDSNLEIYQGDEGLFVFTTPMNMTDELTNHLDGHHKILVHPIIVSGRKVDLRFGFGIDDSFHTTRSVSTRLNSAMVAAVETATESVRWKQYESERASGAAWKLTLLGDLDEAVAERKLKAVFQPKYDLQSRRIIGFEALARWTHPTRGVISPEIFIRAAEDNNRINALTCYMLNDSIECAARLRKMGMVHAIAVNLSSSLLTDAGLVRMITAILAAHDFPSQMLTLELTESGRAISGDKAIAMLHLLHEAGIRLSIDDYGTGNATMDYVQGIPSHELKIDKKFIIPMLESTRNRSIVEAMISMAHNLGRVVVAEGVETSEIEEILRNMGCDVGQGYALARPMDFLELVKLMRNERRRFAA
jgi:diguanylate cyclase